MSKKVMFFLNKFLFSNERKGLENRFYYPVKAREIHEKNETNLYLEKHRKSIC